MTDAHKDPPIVDPDHISETLCIGTANVTTNGSFATLTFTHYRPKVGLLIANGMIENEAVVRARIVTTVENLAALRDVINGMILDPSLRADTVSGSSKLN